MELLKRTCTVLTLAVAPALYANAALQLETPTAGSHFSPREALILRSLDGDLALPEQGLWVELDAIDITAMLQRGPNGIRYTPLQPLSQGRHELRVVLRRADGSVEELGYWTFDVAGEVGFGVNHAQGQFDLNLTQRLDAHHLTEPSAVRHAEGSGNVQVQAHQGAWQLDARTDLFLNSEREKSFGGQPLDMDNFVLSARQDKHYVQLGIQNIGAGNLIIDEYLKRGVAIGSGFDTLDSRFDLFSLRSSPTLGLDDGLGLNDADNRTTGGTWHSILTRSDKAEVHLSGGYLSGRRKDSGAFTFNLDQDTPVQQGDAWNLMIDHYFAQRTTRLRLETAHTRFDPGMPEFGQTRHEDRAHSALFSVSSVDPQDYTATRRWTLGVQATEVGSHFRSIANDLLPSDKAMQGLFAQYLHDRWLIDSALARETNNLDDLAERSTTEIRQGHVQVNYTDYMPQDSGLHAWLGSPAHSVRVQRARGQDRTTAPGLFPTDYTTDTVTTALQFNQTHWNWGLGYTYSRFEDHADTQVDTDTRTSSVNTQFLIDPRLTLTLGGQLQTTRNRDFGTRADYRIATIGTQFILIPDRLFGQLNAQFNADRARRDPFFARDTRQDVYGGELVWRWLQPEQAAAGVDVVLSVASQSWRDHVFQQGIDGHQIFLSLRSSLPVSYNGGL